MRRRESVWQRHGVCASEDQEQHGPHRQKRREGREGHSLEQRGSGSRRLAFLRGRLPHSGAPLALSRLSLELVRLVEEAGKDWVGVNMDSGNAVWTLEDPFENLKNLAPYVLTTSLRDTMAWPSENGYTAAWTAMGEGLVQDSLL